MYYNYNDDNIEIFVFKSNGILHKNLHYNVMMTII